MNEQEKRRYREEQNALNPSAETMERLCDAARKAETHAAEKTGEKHPRVACQKTMRRYAVACLAAAMLLAFCLPIGSLLSPANQAEARNFQDYGELFDLINENRKKGNGELTYIVTDGEITLRGEEHITSGYVGGVSLGTDTDNTATTPLASAAPEHSDTNNQVYDVQEGDVVKTDGTYIYSLKRVQGESESSDLCISYPDEAGNALFLASLPLSEIFEEKTKSNQNASHEMFLCEAKLILIRSRSREDSTLISILDVSDASVPRVTARLEQSGTYNSARLIDGTLYLVSDHNPRAEYIRKSSPTTYIPSCGSTDEQALLAPEEIHTLDPEAVSGFSYTVVSALSLEEERFVSRAATLGITTHLYANRESLYVLSASYKTPGTSILRFALENGTVRYCAAAKINGYALNQFSMQEKDGVFTIVTTYTDSLTQAQYNGIYTFDRSLQPLGSLDGLGKDERVYSVRFDGDVCYFVTYRQTDPVFCVDLSDAAAPKLLSALKIPGFSSYLHVWDKNTLVGLGRADENEDGSTEGLKLSFFDTSDQESLSERQKILFGDYTASAPAEENHKAILVAPEKNVIAFAYHQYDRNNESNLDDVAFIALVKETEDGFELHTLDFPRSNEEENGFYVFFAKNTRFLYIGDVLCVVMPDGIQTIDLTSFSCLSTLWF